MLFQLFNMYQTSGKKKQYITVDLKET